MLFGFSNSDDFDSNCRKLVVSGGLSWPDPTFVESQSRNPRPRQMSREAGVALSSMSAATVQEDQGGIRSLSQRHAQSTTERDAGIAELNIFTLVRCLKCFSPLQIEGACDPLRLPLPGDFVAP